MRKMFFVVLGFVLKYLWNTGDSKDAECCTKYKEQLQRFYSTRIKTFTETMFFFFFLKVFLEAPSASEFHTFPVWFWKWYYDKYFRIF